MDRAWSESDAQQAVAHYGAAYGCNRDLALRVYSSRLLGRQADLVLHGGGNTSVKTRMVDDLGDEIEVLCVKGSGWDLGVIEPPGFPALRLAPLQALRERERLSDEEMVNAARIRMLDAAAPNPSVETLLHAFLPHKFIDHSHADAILATVDQAEAVALAGEIHGERLAIVPYIMPGFALAKLAAEVYELYEPLAEDRGLIPEARIEPCAWVLGERNLIAQLVSNLLDNAIKFTGPGDGVTLSVTAGERHMLTVADTGPGVPEDIRATVFDRFTRGERDRAVAGHGLGLALVQAIAARHGAKLSLPAAPRGFRIEIAWPSLPRP